MKLGRSAFDRARAFVLERARPLEGKLFLHDFERGGARAVLDALEAFRNADGGFGRGLEPDLRLPDSSVLATTHALRVLREAGTEVGHGLVRGAIAWLAEAYEPALGAWRSVPPEAEEHPHADHWRWELHRDGGPWPRALLPRAEILAHLFHWRACAPPPLLEEVAGRFAAELPRVEPSCGGDALAACEALVQTPAAPAALREITALRVRELGVVMVSRDPAEWTRYVTKPLKLATSPRATLAEELAPDVARNLDWEIAQQASDGSWLPNWDWHGRFPAAWETARREWQGELTLQTLRALRAWGRIEGL